MPNITVRQEEIEVNGNKYTITNIPTATSGSWYVVHDLFEVWAAVAIDDANGDIIGWRNPPEQPLGALIEEAIKKAFGYSE